jgi:entericidin B
MSYRGEIMKYLVIAMAIIVTGIMTSGCNTMQGMGKDIKKGGEKLEDSAAKHKHT